MEFEQKGSKGTKQESKLSKSTRAIISLLSNLITKWEWWGGGGLFRRVNYCTYSLNYRMF